MAQQTDPSGQYGRGKKSGMGNDTTLKHRTGLEDSITINFRFLDSSRLKKFDSTIYDFSARYPLPNSYFDLGNTGTAAKNLVFAPTMKSGWDQGMHAYDIYMFKPDDTRFYHTTRPFTTLGYIIGSKQEQIIDLVHTQNIKPNWNASFQYRLINAPGFFNNQNTNHNNYRFSNWYQSKNKRYQLFVIILGAKLKSSENGGIRPIGAFNDPQNLVRSNVSTELGGATVFQTNPFSTSVNTGSLYTTGEYIVRQQYDIIGKKDSIVTDTSVTPLFYPKFRAEYTFKYNTYHYEFLDQSPDTSYYVHHFNFISTPDTVTLRDNWKQLTNDFSLYSFPDSKNPQQFLKAGIATESLKGDFDAGTRSLFNVYIHGEYRNKTKNQKWDVEALGNFYLSGYNAADYNAFISLRRLISRNIGYLQVGFQNVNKTASFATTKESSFGLGAPGYLNKENTTHFFGSLDLPALKLTLGANYYLLSNYIYYYNYYHIGQETNPFNILQINADKVLRYRKYWVARVHAVFQQKTGASPINLPVVVAYGQFGYEGKLGFRNLDISFGLEFRYFSAYKADGYAPVVGQFYLQNDSTIRQKLPDLNLYINFRIRTFTAYLRGENLNSLQFSGQGGPGFYNNNFVAPNYPYPGLRIRVGIFWNFIN